MYSTHKLTPDGKHLQTPLKANYVGISEIFITNDWYNLKYGAKIQTRIAGLKTPVISTPLSPGLYTFNALAKRAGLTNSFNLSNSNGHGIMSDLNGYICITIPPNIDLKMSNNLLHLLGIAHGGWFDSESKHISDYIAPITQTRVINIHLDGVERIVDGEPSTMIGKVMLDNGRSTQKLYTTPQMHKVVN